MVSGHQAPAFTVASLATTIAGPFDLARARNHPRPGSLPVILIVCDQQADFEKHRTRIQQLRDSLARRELAVAVLFLDPLGAAALAQLIFERLQIIDKLTHLTRAGGGHHSQNTVLAGALHGG